MDQKVYENVKILWDYMHMDMEPQKADIIVGFGCYNEEIALRTAELYFEGFAPKILFTGGLGRNTKKMWDRSEAERFAEIAMKAGVPEKDILMENRSTNTGENILFTKEMLAGKNIKRILGVHKPFMERRVYGAMGIYWPEAEFIVTSPQVSIFQYVALSEQQGVPENRVIEILVGDFQRVEVYAKKGYQTPQPVSNKAQEAFQNLVDMGYTGELVK